MSTSTLDIFEAVKQCLRISNTAQDNEVADLIAAAKKDLEIAGIKKLDEKDPLIRRAIILYAKTNFGYDNPDSEKFRLSYETLKVHLMLTNVYNGGAEDGEVG